MYRRLITITPIAIGRSRIKVLSLSELGRAALGIAAPEADRLGGPEHRYWRRRMADHLRAQGYEVREEAPLGGGQTVDVLATRGGQRVAFEIETGKSDMLADLQKCPRAGFDKIIVVATTPSVCNRVQGALPPDPRVSVQTPAELFHGRLD